MFRRHMRIAKALCGRLPSASTALFPSARALFCPWTGSSPLLQPTERQYNRNKGTQCIRSKLSCPMHETRKCSTEFLSVDYPRPLMSTRSRENPGRMSPSSRGSAVVHIGACTCLFPASTLLFAAASGSTRPEGWCCLSLARIFASFFWSGSFARTPCSLEFCVFVWCARSRLSGILEDADSVLWRASSPVLLHLVREDHWH